MTSPQPTPSSVSALLAVERLHVSYGRRVAVDGVSLAVPEGSVYALLGRNGAGKSSIIRCLLGERQADSGRALIFGRDTWKDRAAIMTEVGVVPEEPNAPPNMSARALSRFCARLYPRWDAASVDERLRRFGVPAEIPFGQLSKGQKGQVAMALALAHQPRLLILDDPTLGLDRVARKAVFAELIGDLADRGTTVFLTTHELDAVERIADRVGILAAGKLLLDEELETLKRRFRRLRFPRAAEGQSVPAELEPIAVNAQGFGTETVVANYREGIPAAQGHGVEVTALTLDEIFVALVGSADGAKP
jgi:ABC-2 type transport system ATP-binding protein